MSRADQFVCVACLDAPCQDGYVVRKYCQNEVRPIYSHALFGCHPFLHSMDMCLTWHHMVHCASQAFLPRLHGTNVMTTASIAVLNSALRTAVCHRRSHEDMSTRILCHLLDSNHIDLPDDDVVFVQQLVAGTPLPADPDQRWLFDIVANKRNGIDVDKFDYLKRDSHCTGVKISLDYNRILHYSRIAGGQVRPSSWCAEVLGCAVPGILSSARIQLYNFM